MLIVDDVFAWEGWGGRLRLEAGKCRLKIFDLRKALSQPRRQVISRLRK